MKIKRGFITAEKISLRNYKFKTKNILLEKKDIDFDISFYEGILRKNPYLIDCLNFLGNAYTSKEMHEKGLEIDKRLSRLRPDDPIIIYNLACSYALSNKIDLSISTLKRAIDLGYNDIEHLESDKDIDNIRSDKRYKLLINILRKKRNSIAVKF